MNYKAEMEINGSKGMERGSNSLVFATEKEALASGKELMSRWMLVMGYKAIETKDPVNYRFDFDQNQNVSLEREEAPHV